MGEEKKRILHNVFDRDTPQERIQLINELDREIEDPFITIRLTQAQVQRLSAFIALLPFHEFRALTLWHCLRYKRHVLATLLKEEKVNGLVNYLQDRLTQCMDLPRPIAKWYWYCACSKAMDIYQYQNEEPQQKMRTAK